MSPSSCQLLSSWATTEQSRQQLLHLQRLATVGGMTSQIAHELNNTLTALLGWAQQGMKAGQNPELAGKALRQVSVSAERAAEICRGLLGLSRLQTGPKEMVPVNDIIKEATSSLAGRLDKTSISLRCRCPDNLAVYGQRVELTQVLLNMLINSCQAMADRGGTINISADQDNRTGCVNVNIADSGPGISPENIRRIFEPFFSTRQSPDPAGHGGTGLGLAVCRDIVAAHGGFIEVDSVQGQGASFTIFLPSSPT